MAPTLDSLRRFECNVASFSGSDATIANLADQFGNGNQGISLFEADSFFRRSPEAKAVSTVQRAWFLAGLLGQITNSAVRSAVLQRDFAAVSEISRLADQLRKEYVG